MTRPYIQGKDGGATAIEDDGNLTAGLSFTSTTPSSPTSITLGPATLEALFRRMLEMLGENPDRPGLVETPKRMAQAWGELTDGYREDPASVIKLFPPEGPNQNEIVIVRDVPFVSLCEHHGLPFTGRVDLAYIPQEGIIGLSKIPRLVNILAHRLQVQERLTVQIAETFMEHVKPLGVMVVATARHECMELRGVKAIGSTTITSCLRGVFQYNPEARREVLSLLGRD